MKRHEREQQKICTIIMNKKDKCKKNFNWLQY